MIKAVIFDWGGVLIDDPAKGLVEYCAQKLGVPVTEFKEVFHRYNEIFDLGQMSEDDLWVRVCQELQVAPLTEGSLWGAAFRSIYKEKPQMWQLIADLKKAGYQTGLLSNTEMPVVKFAEEHHFEDHFDVMVFSCVEGLRKPGKEIYDLTLKRLAVQPEEAIFIDDKLENVVGAKLVGLRDILFKDPKQVVTEIKSHGVKV